MIHPLEPEKSHIRSVTDASVELFDAVAAAYARHRPTYPPAWFSRFAERAPARQRVWDCGCGNGQASQSLAETFEQVIATDASPSQIQQAIPHPKISYRCSSATASGLEPMSVDAILVAQAVHWFAGETFNAEVRRVARPGALMAWIGYLPPQFDSEVLQALFDQFYGVVLRPWWAPQRAWVDRRYQGLPFPGEEWPFPDDLWIERRWNLAELLNYLATWSAVETAQRSGVLVLEPLANQLQEAWPDQGLASLPLRWPMMGRWGSVSR